jgi:hypothetical protein
MDYVDLKALIEQRGVHAVFGDYGEGWGIEQSSVELAHFLTHMQQLGVSSILEVGTGYKAGLARFLHDDLGWRVTSVDIRSYGHAYDGIEFLHPDDFTYDTAFGVPPQQYDLVLLDADHSYDGVKDQHEFYAPYATKVIAFHDIAGLRDCGGVRAYWAELARDAHWEKVDGINQLVDPLNPGCYELISQGDQRGGIGYIVLAEVEAPKSLEEAIATRDEQAYADAQNAAKEQPPAKKPATRKPAARKPTAAKKATVKK